MRRFVSYGVLSLVVAAVLSVAPSEATRGACMGGCINRFMKVLDDYCDQWWCGVLPGCRPLCYEAAYHDLEICLGRCLADKP